jgi:predicted transposase/invertase (TIGR01784 family)
VEESDYHNVMIQKIFASIEEDGLTPRDRYDMIEEYEDRKLLADKEKEAKLEEKKEIAKNLLAANVAIEIIAQTTGLSLSEIESLNNPLLNDEEK